MTTRKNANIGSPEVNLELKVTKNNAPADGSAENKAQVKTTHNRHDVSKRVVFKLDGSAVFKESGTNQHTVKTQLDGIAKVSFTDKFGETKLIHCWLHDDETDKAVPQQFSFTSEYKLAWGSNNINNAPAGLPFLNQCQVVATYKGQPVRDGTKITFKLPKKSSAEFDWWWTNYCDEGVNDKWTTVKTQMQDGQSVATAFFFGKDAETVTLHAQFADRPEVKAPPRQFNFVSPAVMYLQADNGKYAHLNEYNEVMVSKDSPDESCKFTFVNSEYYFQFYIMGSNGKFLNQDVSHWSQDEDVLQAEDDDKKHHFVREGISPYTWVFYLDNDKYVSRIYYGVYHQVFSASKGQRDAFCNITVSWPDANS